MGTFVYLEFSVHLWHMLSEGHWCDTQRSTHFVPSPTSPSKEILLRCPCLCSYLCLLSCSVMFDSLWPWWSLQGSSVHGIFFRQEYWSGLPCPPPGTLPEPEIEPTSPVSPALAGRFFTSLATGILCLTYFQYRHFHSLFLCYTLPIHLNSS